MPFINLVNNPLMEMIDTYQVLNIIEKVLGVSTVISMIFLVNSSAKGFSIDSVKEKVFLFLSILLLLGYYISWIFYFSGHHELSFVLITLVSFVPLYYASIGLWRNNYILVFIAILFLFAHIANVWTSY